MPLTDNLDPGGLLPGRRIAASFRDPSGFVFERDGALYRQVNSSYRENYDRLMRSGLYDKLVEQGRLVAHQEVELHHAAAPGAYKVLQPNRAPFVSYPYEWCFSQLKDAALATIRIQKLAFEHGLSLKDSSAYNIQFVEGRPVLIDTLSFESYQEGEPWVAYRQYCQHFLGPLALIANRDFRLASLLKHHIDGIPVDLASKLLPVRTRLKWPLLIHIHLHARSQTKHAGAKLARSQSKVSRLGFQGLMDSLESGAEALHWRPQGDWAQYYSETNYSEPAFERKKELVSEFLQQSGAAEVWDLGANVGLFSRLAADQGKPTLSMDSDPASVEANYLECRRSGRTRLLPLLIDLVNPSPSLGWASRERDSLIERGPTDLAMALALIHHLVIANNVPLLDVAKFFAKLCRGLIIEFVPKQDSQVQRLLASRVDIFDDYTQQGFERAFEQCFSVERTEKIAGTERVLYLMRTRS